MHDSEDQYLSDYRGVPKSAEVTERSKWQQFLYKVLPWLEKKVRLGEDYLEAKVQTQQAVAFKTYAEGLVQIETAKKIAREASEQERIKLTEVDIAVFDEKAFDQKLTELVEKINLAQFKYGMNLIAQIKEENPITVEKQLSGDNPHNTRAKGKT